MRKLLVYYLSRSRNRHFLVFDVVVFLLTPALALVLRTDGISDIAWQFPSLLVVTLLFLAIKVAAFYLGGLYSRFWRYASIEELGRIALVGIIVLLVQTVVLHGFLLSLGWVSPGFPRSIPLIDGVLAIGLVGMARYSVRLSERLGQPRLAHGDAVRVLVAGAGWAGVTIVKEMQRNPHLGLDPVGFVDDDPAKQRASIRGVRVLGRCSDIPAVAREVHARQVIIAMPSVAGKDIRRVVQICEDAGVHVKIIPGMYELLDGTVHVKHLRDVRIDDLLRRDPIQTDTSAIAEMVLGKRILVTGGGGSIGSELCRQLLRFNPESLIILGHGENSVFEIQDELVSMLGSLPMDEQNQLPLPKIHSVIADIRMIDRLWSVFERYRPEVVFHAAAHKHVPLMELNPVEAITNNVLGTKNLLQVSAEMGVERFVMISSDKAVNPTSIMGASKRAAELLTHQAAMRTGRPYVAVRFGNVLGSRGSVVLTFQKQIAAGQPVTVTHPEMKRYFMTIPEAVQLVLQAATLGVGGEIFMLDMGEPIKISDLARDVIKLSGLEPGRDIDIHYTGVRPGEKLFEELYLEGEEYKRTAHDKIFVVAGPSSSVPWFLDEAVGQLGIAALRADERAVVKGLQMLVPEFHPGDQGYQGDHTGVQPERSPLPQPQLVPTPLFHRTVPSELKDRVRDLSPDARQSAASASSASIE
jgi:FlaA1/EpsC-like NDP-sugar epimerase